MLLLVGFHRYSQGRDCVMALEASTLGNSGLLKPKGSGDQAAAYIRKLIFEGELRPGERLPQDLIAKSLGISRIPVREAIVALEREGWLTTRFHHGAFVNTFDEDTIRDHYELFGLVYALASRRAIHRNEPELASRLNRIARETAKTDDPAEVERLAVSFHGMIVEAADSPRIRLVLRAMSALVPGPFFDLVPDAIAPEKQSMSAIVRAIRKGDEQRASQEYERTLMLQGEFVVELFREHDLLAAGDPA
jgi:DNA-binding GntR family transcriptional regulator